MTVEADSWYYLCLQQFIFIGSTCNVLHGNVILNADTHTHTHPFNSPFSGTTLVSQYQKGKTNLDFTEATNSVKSLKARSNADVIRYY